MKKRNYINILFLSLMLVFAGCYKVSSYSFNCAYALEEEKNVEDYTFDEYKEYKRSIVESFYNDSLSTAGRELLDSIIAKLESTTYNEGKSLADNKLVLDAVVFDAESISKKLEVVRSKSKLNSYKTLMSIEVEELLVVGDSKACEEIVKAGMDEILSFEYREDQSLSENQTRIDEIVFRIKNNLETQRYNDLHPPKKSHLPLIIASAAGGLFILLIVLYLIWRRGRLSGKFFDKIFYALDPIFIGIVNVITYPFKAIARLFISIRINAARKKSGRK